MVETEKYEVRDQGVPVTIVGPAGLDPDEVAAAAYVVRLATAPSDVRSWTDIAHAAADFTEVVDAPMVWLFQKIGDHAFGKSLDELWAAFRGNRDRSDEEHAQLDVTEQELELAQEAGAALDGNRVEIKRDTEVLMAIEEMPNGSRLTVLTVERGVAITVELPA